MNDTITNSTAAGLSEVLASAEAIASHLSELGTGTTPTTHDLETVHEWAVDLCADISTIIARNEGVAATGAAK